MVTSDVSFWLCDWQRPGFVLIMSFHQLHSRDSFASATKRSAFLWRSGTHAQCRSKKSVQVGEAIYSKAIEDCWLSPFQSSALSLSLFFLLSFLLSCLCCVTIYDVANIVHSLFCKNPARPWNAPVEMLCPAAEARPQRGLHRPRPAVLPVAAPTANLTPWRPGEVRGNLVVAHLRI